MYSNNSYFSKRIQASDLVLVLVLIFSMSPFPPVLYADNILPSLQSPPSLEQFGSHDKDLRSLPKYLPPQEEPGIDLPPLPPAPVTQDLSTAPTILVRLFNFSGNTIFSDETLRTVTRPYENRKITNEELHELRYKLTMFYVDQGFINSGVIIPDQKITDQTVTFRVVEGKLTNIHISGNQRLKSSYVNARILLDPAAPLNIHTLQEKFQLLHQNPLIKKINAKIGPGLQLGEAILDVNVTEQTPYHAGLTVSNHHSPSSGELLLHGEVGHRNLTGRGDAVLIEYEQSEGANNLAFFYQVPINAKDTSLKIRYQTNDSTIIEEPFDIIDIDGESETYGVTLLHPFYKTPSRELIGELTGEIRSSKTFLFDKAFSFSPGVKDGESNVTVIRMGASWISRRQSQVFAARGVINWGVDLFDATDNDSSDPDGQFLNFLLQLQYAKRLELFKDSQLIVKTDMQLSKDRLLPLEKFSVGGFSSVRGYRENQIIRDNGLVVSVEYRIPVSRLRLPGISKKADDGLIQVAPFVDCGWAWETEIDTPSPKSIASFGLGLRWNTSDKMHAAIYIGNALRDLDNPADNLQGVGVSFLWNWRFF